jgi:hypothetical protein
MEFLRFSESTADNLCWPLKTDFCLLNYYCSRKSCFYLDLLKRVKLVLVLNGSYRFFTQFFTVKTRCKIADCTFL